MKLKDNEGIPLEIKQPLENQGDFLSEKEILDFTPRELQKYLILLESSGKLEDFLQRACKSDVLVAQFSYWEKWMRGAQRNLVEDIVKKKKEMYPGEKDSLPLDLEKKFTHEELKIILSNVGAIQLTFGCSKGCPFCGFDAIKGVREYIPYPQLANLFQRYGVELGKTSPFLYWASEPSDYVDPVHEKTYRDVHQLAATYAGYFPHITTRNYDKDFLDFVESTTFLGSKHRISAEYAHEDTVEVLKKYKVVGVLEGGHRRGLGVSLGTENEEDRQANEIAGGIGCFDGVLITPRGIYNVFQASRTEELPQAQAIVPFEKFSETPIQEGDSIQDMLRGHIVLRQTSYSGRPNERFLILLGKNNDTYEVLVGSDLRAKKVLLNPVIKEKMDMEERKRKSNALRLEFLYPVVSRFISLCKQIYMSGTDDERNKSDLEYFPTKGFIRAFELIEKEQSEGRFKLLGEIVTWIWSAYRGISDHFKMDEYTRKELDALHEEIKKMKKSE